MKSLSSAWLKRGDRKADWASDCVDLLLWPTDPVTDGINLKKVIFPENRCSRIRSHGWWGGSVWKDDRNHLRCLFHCQSNMIYNLNIFCFYCLLLSFLFYVFWRALYSIIMFLRLILQEKEEQWMTKLVPGMNDFAVLQPLQWNTRYNVEITARNLKGLSEPTFFQFLMPQKPDITGTCMQRYFGLLKVY